MLTQSSSAQPSLEWARHTSWREAVRKPDGLKKPVSQKLKGRPFWSHVVSCSARLTMLANHTPITGCSGSDTGMTLAHGSGTLASKSASTAPASMGA